MSRLLRVALLTGLLAILTACGAAGTPGSSSMSTATMVSATTEIVDVPAAATITVVPTPETDPPPVTAMMESLRLAGERFATAGEPNAPITVVEFSDFG